MPLLQDRQNCVVVYVVDYKIGATEEKMELLLLSGNGL